MFAMFLYSFHGLLRTANDDDDGHHNNNKTTKTQKKLAFRSCHALRERKLSDVRRILGAVESSDERTVNLDKAVKQHLKDTAETFAMGDVERQVANQV